VLVVIGVILAAMSIGRDLHRGAIGLQVYSNFVQPWAVAYNEYFARAYVVVGDDVNNPQLKVAATSDTPLCDSPAPPGGVDTLRTLMQSVGIEMPSGRAEGRESRMVFLDSNGNPQELRVCFENVEWYVWDPAAGASGDYVYKYVNVMVLSGLNPDMARRLDGIIDGTPQPCYGLFRVIDALPPDDPDCAWGADNRDAFGAGAYNIDENQVAVVTAHYRMNQ